MRTRGEGFIKSKKFSDVLNGSTLGRKLGAALNYCDTRERGRMHESEERGGSWKNRGKLASKAATTFGTECPNASPPSFNLAT